MFDFLFKRSAGKPAESAAAQQAQANASATTAAEQADSAARRAEQVSHAKNLAGNEAGAVEFILQSEFADVRLLAAEHVRSQALLEQVHQAMRNTDRRVAKLMQGRLDMIRHEQAEQRRAEGVIAGAERLLADTKLSPNQVAELDRLWQVIQPTPALAERFAPVRAALAQRLETQVALQRSVIDAVSALRRLLTAGLALDAAAASLGRLTEEHAVHLASPEQASLPKHLFSDFNVAHAAAQASVDTLARHGAAVAARQAALAEWQAAAAVSHAAAPAPAPVNPAPLDPAPADAAPAQEPSAAVSSEAEAESSPAELTEAGPADAAPASAEAPNAEPTKTEPPKAEPLNAETLRRQWAALPALPDDALAAGLQQRFEAILAGLPQPTAAREAGKKAAPAQEHKKNKPKGGEPRAADPHFLETLDAMDAALQQGLLQLASEHDKTLRDSKSGHLSPAQSERLLQVRADFKRLADWARWGGNVSREELVKAADELPAQKLGMAELAKKVGSLRERWKSLDTLSGPAPKVLWERFDAACTTAYAPAAAHFKQLAGERQGNAAKAQALIDEAAALAAGAMADGALAAGADLKQAAAASQRLRQAWTRLGTIDRKEKKRLDAAFGAALDALSAPLEQQRRIEAARREQLIAEVGLLKPHERNTVDMLRALQEKWQELARALPLERRVEQALWQKFRAACDEVFAKRKEVAHAADHERKAHLHAKEAICAGLETAAIPEEGSDKAKAAAIAALLRTARADWSAVGPVPRASEARIEQRFAAAVAKVQALAEAIVQRAGAAQANALRDKLRLCQALETVVAAADTGGPTGDEVTGSSSPDNGQSTGKQPVDWNARWAALPSLDNAYERLLHARFNAAMKALTEQRAAYAALLELNRAKLQDEVLRMEIVAGVDSGAEFARERLKMQVEVLQSSLKSGQKPLTAAAQFQQLCAIPALADARTAGRIEVLLRRIGGADGK